MSLAWRPLTSKLQARSAVKWISQKTQDRWSLLVMCLPVTEMLCSLINSLHYFPNCKILGSNSSTFPEKKKKQNKTASFNICAYSVKDHFPSRFIASVVLSILYVDLRISFSPDRGGLWPKGLPFTQWVLFSGNKRRVSYLASILASEQDKWPSCIQWLVYWGGLSL